MTDVRRLEDYPEVMTVQDVADYFGVERSTIHLWRRTDRLELDPIPVGSRRLLFSRFQVERLVRGETTPT